MRDFDSCDIEFEETDCPFCKDKTEKEVLFTVPDRISKLPGRFNLVRCKNCGLVFQNPRPKEEYIKYYYPDEAGYFQPPRKKQNKYLQWIGKNIRINFYNYYNLGKRNFTLRCFYFLCTSIFLDIKLFLTMSKMVDYLKLAAPMEQY